MLLILLVGLTVVFALVLWVGSVFLQGWLYNDLAEPTAGPGRWSAG